MSFGVFPFSKDFCENIGIQSLYCFILSKKNVLLKAVGCRKTIFCFYYFLWSLQQQKCNEIRKIQDFLLRRTKLSTLSRVLLAGDVDLTALQEGMLKVISVTHLESIFFIISMTSIMIFLLVVTIVILIIWYPHHHHYSAHPHHQHHHHQNTLSTSKSPVC